MNSKLEIFTIFDSKAKAYLQPFFSLNVETAKREFSAAVNGEGPFAQFAEDYALFSLGVFDQNEGDFDITIATHICNAVTLRTVQSFPMTNSPAEAAADWSARNFPSKEDPKFEELRKDVRDGRMSRDDQAAHLRAATGLAHPVKANS